MILFVRDLTVIDFSYLCQTRGMLGESFIVDVELHGGLDDASMVLDFSLEKKVIKQAIDQLLDHKLAVPGKSQALQLNGDADYSVLSFQSARGRIQMAAPAQALAVVPSPQIDVHSLTAFLHDKLMPLMPAHVKQLVLSLRPEASNGFYYHYSHGLKKHDGNCQRIAHGHRSTIQIYTDGMLAPRLNKYWSERWEDIYLATAEDQIEASALRYLKAEAEALNFAYSSAQGYFEISLPATTCEVVPCDTTVECLADYIAASVKESHQLSAVKVVAFEGVGKGAIAFA